MKAELGQWCTLKILSGVVPVPLVFKGEKPRVPVLSITGVQLKETEWGGRE